MTREQAKQEVRSRWKDIIIKYADPAKKKGQYICPFCGHGAHGDGIKDNPKSKDGYGLKCFGACQFSGDIIDFVMKATGEDFNSAFKSCCEDLHLIIDQAQPKTASRPPRSKAEKKPEPVKQAEPIADYTDYYLKCKENILMYEAGMYLNDRGLNIDIAWENDIGYDPEWISPTVIRSQQEKGSTWKPPATKRIILPISKNHYIARAIDPDVKEYAKMNETGGGKAAIFYSKSVNYESQENIFVVEGIFDALSIIMAGAAAVAINSTSNAQLFIDQLKSRKLDSNFIICLDNDEAGKKAAGVISRGLDQLNINCIAADICVGYKDPNEAFVNDKESFKKAIGEAERKASGDSLTDFLEKIQTEAYKPYKTELSFFDNLLNGGVIRQTLLLLLAAPGTGKTTLCAQIAEQMAYHKKPVLYINLEMSREQMLAKAISGRLARKGKSMTALEILQGYKWTEEQKTLVMDAISDYKENIQPYLSFNPDGVGSNLESIKSYLNKIGERAKAAKREAPVIVLDYLHLISCKGLDIQELIKQAVIMLKQYAIEYNTFVIGIVATNRTSNSSGKITMESGRDSSNLEYTADYQLSLNYYDIDQGKVKPDDVEGRAKLEGAKLRQMIIRVLKGRLGTSGRAAKVYFHAANNIFYGQHDWMPADLERTPFDNEQALGKEGKPKKVTASF